MRKIHAIELHTKFGHTREDYMSTTRKHLQYSVKGTLDLCEDFATGKRNHKSLYRVAEE